MSPWQVAMPQPTGSRDPSTEPAPSRDELAMKLAIAASLDGVDVAAIIQTQREATASTLQDLTRTKSAGGDPASPTSWPGCSWSIR